MPLPAGLLIRCARGGRALVERGRTPRRRPDDRRGADLEIEDPLGFANALRKTERFSRDTHAGGMFHRGKISIREVSRAHSLHVTVSGERLSAHLDTFSPLATKSWRWMARYSILRVILHNVVHVLGTGYRLIMRRRPDRLELDCSRVEIQELSGHPVADVEVDVYRAGGCTGGGEPRGPDATAAF
ncbi:MAG: hypothetical protein ABR575_10415 [Actinomycetota bacterium]